MRLHKNVGGQSREAGAARGSAWQALALGCTGFHADGAGKAWVPASAIVMKRDDLHWPSDRTCRILDIEGTEEIFVTVML